MSSSRPPGPCPPLLWVCPSCRQPLLATEDGALSCASHQRVYRQSEGVWRLLSEADARRWSGFLDLYRMVRDDEGWGQAKDASWYRDLPSVPREDPHAAIWNVREASFRVLSRQIVLPLAERRGRGLVIADLGAGNGWLAHRLARLGHLVAAVDLDDHPADGLGACRHYGDLPTCLPVQATFERLPWADDSFDLALWNGALHYAENVATVLAEALRVLRPGGHVAVLDTPFYRHRVSGEAMLAERNAAFRLRHGTASPFRHEGFLTLDRLHALGGQLDLAWQIHRPWYGLTWALRPLKNRLLGLREPARFFVIEGQRRS